MENAMTTEKNLTSIDTISKIRDYWNEHIHDLEIARHPVGTKEFFAELESYRFEKLDYLPKVVEFNTYQGKSVLEVGCGVGIGLVDPTSASGPA